MGGVAQAAKKAFSIFHYEAVQRRDAETQSRQGAKSQESNNALVRAIEMFPGGQSRFADTDNAIAIGDFLCDSATPRLWCLGQPAMKNVN